MEWKKARKLPVIIEYREPIPNNALGDPCEIIYTREGVLRGYPDIDYIIRGVDGELYPIKKEIFEKTYEEIKIESKEERERIAQYICG